MHRDTPSLQLCPWSLNIQLNTSLPDFIASVERAYAFTLLRISPLSFWRPLPAADPAITATINGHLAIPTRTC